MKFDVRFTEGEIRLTLTESLALPEGHQAYLESPSAPESFDLLPQIESRVRQFLNGFVERSDEPDKACPARDCQRPHARQPSIP